MGEAVSLVMLYSHVLDPLSSITVSPVKHYGGHFPASLDTECMSCGRSHTYT